MLATSIKIALVTLFTCVTSVSTWVHGNMEGSDFIFSSFNEIIGRKMLITQPYITFPKHPGNEWLGAKPCSCKSRLCRGSIGYMKWFSDWMQCIYMARAHIAEIEYDISAREISDVAASCFLFVSSNKSQSTIIAFLTWANAGGTAQTGNYATGSRSALDKYMIWIIVQIITPLQHVIFLNGCTIPLCPFLLLSSPAKFGVKLQSQLGAVSACF